VFGVERPFLQYAVDVSFGSHIQIVLLKSN